MTDKVKLYAVKNDNGDYLNGVAGEKPLFGGLDKDCVLNGEDASWWAGRGCGHVVELIEAPAKVVVSQEEANMLKKAKDTTVWRPAAVISDYAYNTAKDSDQEALLEDRLMRAYVNGWTVEKPKRWYVQTPKEWWEEPDIPEWMLLDTLRGVCSGFSKLSRTAFTRAELNQYHLDSDIFTLVPAEADKEVSR